MFGTQALVNLAKAMAKFGLVGGVLYLVVKDRFNDLIALGFMDLKPAMADAGELIGLGAVLVTLTLIIAAAIDVPYQIYEHNKKLKMSKQEVKDELKDTEGRPEVKAQIRRKQREMAMGQMMEAVSEADVVFTIRSIDGYHEMTQTVSVSFEVPDEDGSFASTEIIAGGLGVIVFAVLLLFFLRKTPHDDESILELEETLQEMSGPPTSGPPVSTQASEETVAPEADIVHSSTELVPSVQPQPPTIPSTGLPPGWTDEQWAYYGQQYLDGTL